MNVNFVVWGQDGQPLAVVPAGKGSIIHKPQKRDGTQDAIMLLKVLFFPIALPIDLCVRAYRRSRQG